jgi:hypothetical protein
MVGDGLALADRGLVEHRFCIAADANGARPRGADGRSGSRAVIFDRSKARVHLSKRTGARCFDVFAKWQTSMVCSCVYESSAETDFRFQILSSGLGRCFGFALNSR